MKNKSYKGTIKSKETSSGKKYLYYKSPYQQQKYKSTGLLDTKFNRKSVIEILKKIEYEHETGNIPSEINQKCSELFIIYINHCRNQKQLTQKTLKSYIYSYDKIIKEDFEINKKIILNGKDILYIEYLISLAKNLKLSNNSINIIIRSLGTFINWLIQEEYIPYFNINKHKVKSIPKPIETFSDTEIELILDKLKKVNHKIYYMLYFMSRTGTRGKETLELKFDDVDFENKLIKIPNKIRKDISQTIPLSPSAMEIINLMLIDSKLRYRNKDKIFNYEVSSLRFVTGVLSKVMKELGIEKNVKLHAFRKYFATKVVESGVTPYIAQKLIRHSNIQTTINHYYLVDNIKLHDASQIVEKKFPKSSQNLKKYIQDNTK